MDALFKALNDETRRALLDRLHGRDGQTLTELESGLGMSRFGVMKHLKVLEEANLVVTRRAGRFKHHYLNVVPLQEVMDRWITPLTRQVPARALLDLKANLEGPPTMAPTEKPDFVLETFIRTTPERLWEALTGPEWTGRYYIARAALTAPLVAGEPYVYRTPDGVDLLSGTVLAAEPHRRLEMTFVPGWLGPDAGASRAVYEIEPMGQVCKLTVLHFGIPTGQEGVRTGWARIIASLKSLLETGSALEMA